MGLQHKSIEDLEKELQLPPNQLLAMFNKVVKKIINLLEDINVKQINADLFKKSNGHDKNSNEIIEKMQPLEQSLEDELNEASRKVKAQEMEQKKQLLDINFKQYEIKGTDSEWVDALKLPTSSSYVTVKRLGEKRKVEVDSHFKTTDTVAEQDDQFDKKNKKHKFQKKNNDKKFKNKNK
jgi:N-acetyltransferase 10